MKKLHLLAAAVTVALASTSPSPRPRRPQATRAPTRMAMASSTAARPLVP